MEQLLLAIPIIGGLLSIIRFFKDNDAKIKHLLFIGAVTVLLYFSLDLYHKNKEYINDTKNIKNILSTYENKDKIGFIISAMSFIEKNKKQFPEQYKMIKIYKNKAIYYNHINDIKNLNKLAKDVRSVLVGME